MRHFYGKTMRLPVADPGFPRGRGANPKGGGHQPIIWPISPENCVKMKKFWAIGPLDLPLFINVPFC